MKHNKNSLSSVEMVRKRTRNEELKQHPAWRSSHLFSQKEALLQGQRPFSYLLGQSDCRDQIAVSWVQKDGHIAEAYFKYNPKTKTWFYRNGTPHHCNSFEELLSSIFHCSKEDLQDCN